MVRLLERAQQHTNDAELFAGLVHSCRYCGLLDASVAAHQEALRLDPAVKTTVSWTYWILGQYREAMAASPERALIFYWSLVALGREEEAIPLIREEELKCNTKLRDFYTASRTLLEGKHSECFAAIERISNFSDPEGLYQLARWLAHLGQNSQSLAMLRRVAAGGYFCFPLLARDPWLDPLRTHGEFNEIIREIEDRHREALAVFLEAGGSHLLGMSPHCS